jgi:pyrimidine-nucleoside phosphorylase
VALISDMNQPLGHAVGNSLEVKEALATLRGGGPADLREHCLVVAGHMLSLGGLAPDEEFGKQLAKLALEDGRGLERFRTLVRAQGGYVS